MIRATVHNRIFTLDLLRGFAVLGILLANITYFAWPEMSAMFSFKTLPKSPSEALFETLTLVFVNGKFRTLLAILFGYGMYLQFLKRQNEPGNWPGGYLKRTAFLLLIGVIHGFLIWPGDILSMYAISAFFACLFVKLETKPLIWITAASFGLAQLINAASIGLILFLDSMPTGSSEIPFLSSARELEIFSHGNFLEQLGMRAIMFGIMLCQAPFMAPYFASFFLIGVLLGRTGVLTKPSAHPPLRNALLWIGFGVGLPLNLLALLSLPGGPPISIHLAWEMLVGPLMTPGYLMLVAIAAEKGWFKLIQTAIAKVGRTALSCYLLQSILCTSIFYSWGLGLFGKLEPLGLLGVVGSVWAFILIFAHFWLQRYSLGPVEWLWRSMTEGRRLTLINVPGQAALQELPRQSAPPLEREEQQEAVS